MSNIFKVSPTHFSRGGEKFSRGGFAPLGYGPADYTAVDLATGECGAECVRQQ